MLLAIDPGHTTGVALLTDAGDIVLAHDIADPDNAIETLRGMHTDVDGTVIEEGPPSRQDALLDDLDAHLRSFFPWATWMRPSDWKGTPRARLPLPDGMPPHARDAARMGREHLHRKRRQV